MTVRELDNPKCRECLNAGNKQLTCLREESELCYEKNFQLKYIKHKNNGGKVKWTQNCSKGELIE